MENKKNGIIVFLVLGVVFCLFLVSLGKGIKILNAQKQPRNLDISTGIGVADDEYIKTNVKMSTPEYCTYIHTLARRIPIPIGKEHYFLIMSDDLSTCISIRADENWASKFENGESIDKNGVPIEGYVKELDDKVQTKLSTVKSEYEKKNLNIDVKSYLCIDLFAVNYAKKLVIASIVALIVVIWFIFDFKKNGLLYTEKSAVAKIVTSIASCILLVAIIFIISSAQML